MHCNSRSFLKPMLLLLFCNGLYILNAQTTFSNKTNLLFDPNLHFSGSAIGVADMNGDGLDDIIRLNQAKDLSIEFQTSGNKPFRHLNIGFTSVQEEQWGLCIGDVDNNGYPEVLTGGFYDQIKVYFANAAGSAYTRYNISQPSTFVQGVNFADVNNDGKLDAFVCHDDGIARIFGNNGNNTFSLQSSWIDLSTSPVSDNSGNYGSVWSDVDNDGDLDLYIAKCRQGVNDANDPRRINQLFLNNGDGTYTQDITNASGLRIGAQSWTADFGDIDNDGDFDCIVTNHDVASQLLENNGSGVFTDITQAAGVQITGLPIQGIFRDFDNDGWIDLLVTGSDHVLLHNNGNKTFTPLINAFPGSDLHSFALGDLNHDGFQDVYAGYGTGFNNPSSTPDKLWINNAESGNHFLDFTLEGVQSNRNGVGAKLRLYANGMAQVREVRAGESYGISNSLNAHFGIGKAEQADSLIVFWPSGIKDTLRNITRNQFLRIKEGQCSIPLLAIEALGNSNICDGDTVSLTAPAGYSYLWSTGETQERIEVNTPGLYNCTISNAAGCSAVSNAIEVQLNPEEFVNIEVAGDSIFCVGGGVELLAPASTSYLWSNGETGATLYATQSGQYTVKVQGLCKVVESEAVEIIVLPSPEPGVQGDTIAIGGKALLLASGDSLRWYDAAIGGALIAQGDSLKTDNLFESTTYWVSGTRSYTNPNVFGGMAEHAGTNGPATFNGTLIFNALQPFRIVRTTVYSSKAGVRRFEVRNASGMILDSISVNIETGQQLVELNLDVPVGENLVLGTSQSVNMSALGSVGPQLRRSDQNVSYPYITEGVAQFIGSNANDPTRYYYFYNLELALPSDYCESPRVPVLAFVDPNLVAIHTPDSASPLRIMPNPAAGDVRLESEKMSALDLPAQLLVYASDGRLMVSREIAAAQEQISLQTASWPAGLYRVELRGARTVWQGKLIKK